MPIDVRIDRRRKIVRATPRGTLTLQDMTFYQKSIWSNPDVRRFGELIDMTEVADIAYETPFDVLKVADLSAEMDDPKHVGKTAIVASDKLHLALARMYQAYRDQNPRSRRKIEMFRTLDEALEWLRPAPRKSPRVRPSGKK